MTARSAEAMPAAEQSRIQGRIRDYTDQVMNTEWAVMDREEQLSPDTPRTFDSLRTAVASVRPADSETAGQRADVADALDNVSQARQDRATEPALEPPAVATGSSGTQTPAPAVTPEADSRSSHPRRRIRERAAHSLRAAGRWTTRSRRSGRRTSPRARGSIAAVSRRRVPGVRRRGAGWRRWGRRPGAGLRRAGSVWWGRGWSGRGRVGRGREVRRSAARRWGVRPPGVRF